MTDEQRDQQLLRDLDAIGASLPVIPSSYGELRSLIERLPGPTLPDVRSARTGAALEATVSGFGSSSSPLSGDPVGEGSGASLGVVGQLFYGKANLLIDPAMQLVKGQDPVPITTPVPLLREEWQCWYTLLSGTAPTARGFSIGSERTGISNPHNSNSWDLTTGTWTAAGSIDLFFQSRNPINALTAWPYLLGACRLTRSGVANMTLTNLTSMTIWVEIVDAGGSVLASSTPVDWLAFYAANAIYGNRNLVAAWSSPSAGVAYLRIRCRITASGAGPATRVALSEPQLVGSTIEIAPPFSPIAAGWTPDSMRSMSDSRATLGYGGNIIDISTAAGVAVFTVHPANGTIVAKLGVVDTLIIPIVSTAPSGTSGRIELNDNLDTARGTAIWLGDGIRGKPVTPVGYMPFAFPYGMSQADALSGTFTLPINGGTCLVPFLLHAPMLLNSYVLGNKDAAGAHTLEVRLYVDRRNNGGFPASLDDLYFVAGSDATFTYTPGAASVQGSANVSVNPVVLGPGLYWLALRNTSAAVAAGLGATANPNFNLVSASQTITLAGALGARLDAGNNVAAWTAQNNHPAIALRGKVWNNAWA